MADLPQIHDWMSNLLTMGQWTFIYILSVIVIFVGLSILLRPIQEDGIGAASFGVAIIAFPLFAVVMLALGNFISFMIWLWFGASNG